MNDSKNLLDNVNPQKKGGDKKEKGASMVEYALLVALIAIIAIVAVRVMGQTVSKQFSTIASTLS